MQPNDSAPESRPVLIVSDGEEGHLIEKVIIDQSKPTPAQQTTAESQEDSMEKTKDDAPTTAPRN